MIHTFKRKRLKRHAYKFSKKLDSVNFPWNTDYATGYILLMQSHIWFSSYALSFRVREEKYKFLKAKVNTSGSRGRFSDHIQPTFGFLVLKKHLEPRSLFFFAFGTPKITLIMLILWQHRGGFNTISYATKISCKNAHY